jgi:hypothetical protein
LAVIKGGSFVGSTVLTKTSTLANSDGFPSFSYLRVHKKQTFSNKFKIKS